MCISFSSNSNQEPGAVDVCGRKYTRTSSERNKHLPKQSTALLFVGPKSVAPWNDRVWRIAATAQLVEGSVPYWIVTPTEPTQHPVTSSGIEVVSPHTEAVVDSLLVLLGAHFGDDEVEGRMVESHNLNVQDGVREIAPFYELASATRAAIASRLCLSVRLGLTRLDDFTLMDDSVIKSLREIGFDLDLFSRESESSL